MPRQCMCTMGLIFSTLKQKMKKIIFFNRNLFLPGTGWHILGCDIEIIILGFCNLTLKAFLNIFTKSFAIYLNVYYFTLLQNAHSGNIYGSLGKSLLLHTIHWQFGRCRSD